MRRPSIHLLQNTKGDIENAVMGLIFCSKFADSDFVDQSLANISRRLGPEIYSSLFQVLFGLKINPKEAEQHWKKVMAYHTGVQNQFPGEGDLRVSAYSYLVNVARLLVNPIVIEAEQFQQLTKETLTDELTGLYNYRFFQNIIAREFERAKRYNTPIALMFIDIDHFKRFNDLYGHAEGDETLKVVAKAIQSSVRWCDWVCRYGGEEFVIVASGTTKQNVLPLAGRIQRKLARIDASSLRRIEGRITVSIGVSSYPHDAKSAEELLRKADEALYLAKERGRNRIELYSVIPPSQASKHVTEPNLRSAAS